MKCNFNFFWERHPACYIGLAALLGAYGAFERSPWIFLSLLILLTLGKRRLVFGIGTALSTFLYIEFHYQFPSLPLNGTWGTLYFEPSSICVAQSPFGKRWIYQGVGQSFISENCGKRFPCSISIPCKQGIDRPLANGSYLIQGVLKQISSGRYAFSVKEETPWLPIPHTWSAAEWRFVAKQTVKGFIFRTFPEPRTAEFLSGMLTGEFEDRVMRQEFGRAGLQHIMAISGFHFAIFSSALFMVLRLFLSTKKAGVLVASALGCYVLFLGCSASILRAWIMSVIAMIGIVKEKIAFPLNSLGLAILFLLAVDATLVTSLGYVYSFAVTASILFFYPPFNKELGRLLPPKKYREAIRLSFLDQHAYAVIAFFKGAIALSLAVNVVAIPLTFFYFGKFPLLSLFYNLMVPFLVSVAMTLFLIGLVCPLLHPLNGSLIHFMLNLIYNLPAPLHVSCRMNLTAGWITFYVCLLFISGLLAWEKKSSQAF